MYSMYICHVQWLKSPIPLACYRIKYMNRIIKFRYVNQGSRMVSKAHCCLFTFKAYMIKQYFILFISRQWRHHTRAKGFSQTRGTSVYNYNVSQSFVTFLEFIDILTYHGCNLISITTRWLVVFCLKHSDEYSISLLSTVFCFKVQCFVLKQCFALKYSASFESKVFRYKVQCFVLKYSVSL